MMDEQQIEIFLAGNNDDPWQKPQFILSLMLGYAIALERSWRPKHLRTDTFRESARL